MSSSLTTHTTLLARLVDDSDAGAWREFCERYGELIRGFASRQGLQPADCEDVLQDVLVALSKIMPGFEYDPSRGRFRGFLKTICNRTIFKKFRQNRRAAAQRDVDDLAIESEDAGVEHLWEQEWRQYHLRLAMRTVEVEFGAQDRAAFDAYVVDGRGVRETASHLGLSVDQVYQAKSRILKRLTELIEQQVHDEG